GRPSAEALASLPVQRAESTILTGRAVDRVRLGRVGDARGLRRIDGRGGREEADLAVGGKGAEVEPRRKGALLRRAGRLDRGRACHFGREPAGGTGRFALFAAVAGGAARVSAAH